MVFAPKHAKSLHGFEGGFFAPLLQHFWEVYVSGLLPYFARLLGEGSKLPDSRESQDRALGVPVIRPSEEGPPGRASVSPSPPRAGAGPRAAPFWDAVGRQGHICHELEWPLFHQCRDVFSHLITSQIKTLALDSV